MKKTNSYFRIFALLMGLMLVCNTNAHAQNVVKNLRTGTQYTSLRTAITAAQDGDELQIIAATASVSQSTSSNDKISITKNLTISVTNESSFSTGYTNITFGAQNSNVGFDVGGTPNNPITLTFKCSEKNKIRIAARISSDGTTDADMNYVFYVRNGCKLIGDGVMISGAQAGILNNPGGTVELKNSSVGSAKDECILNQGTLTLEDVFLYGHYNDTTRLRNPIIEENDVTIYNLGTKLNTAFSAIGKNFTSTGIVQNVPAAVCTIKGESTRILGFRDGAINLGNSSSADGSNGGNLYINGGKIYNNYNAGSGGAMRITGPVNQQGYNGSHCTMTGGIIECNYAVTTGGALRLENSSVFQMSGGTMRYNVSVGGGAVRMIASKFDMSGTAEICYNYASGQQDYDGGGIAAVVSTDTKLKDDTWLVISGGEIHHNETPLYGGGITASNKAIVNNGIGIKLDIMGGKVYENKADKGGGGIYILGNSIRPVNVSISGMEIYGNETSPSQSTGNANGGGISMEGGNLTIESGCEIYGNKAGRRGGGIYLYNGNFTMTGGNIGSSNANNGNQVNHGSGGGVYIEGSSSNISIMGGSISNNIATNVAGGSGLGGGIYANPGTGSTTINSQNSNITIGNNRAVNGGGAYIDAGSLTISAAEGKATLIEGNTATTDGGGIYAKSTVDFSNGAVNNNNAANNGGGIYISSTGTLNISGTASMIGNSVTNGQGGGVYQGGIMTADGSMLTVSGNTKAGIANNVYLPNNKTISVGTQINAQSVSLGIYTENEALVGQDIPVLTGSDSVLSNIYNALLAGSSRIIDDRRVHKPKYTSGEGTLYFTKFLYDYDEFTTDFSGDIDSKMQLYKFMCWVNGLNGFAGNPHPNAIGNVTADIDMSDINKWIPIGEKENSSVSTVPFSGTFNGNGHVISNLNFDGLVDYANYGLFGQTQGATIDGVSVLDCNYNKGNAGNLGCIVGDMNGGSLTNSEGVGTLAATDNACVIGGLVGKMTGGEVHSSYASATMTGYQMGGLVGKMESGAALKNSFANATVAGGATTGGLVGSNGGTVENCYVRGSDNLVGTSSTGTVDYCYSSAGSPSGTNGIFTATSTPYQYKHADNQVTANNVYVSNGQISDFGALKGLLATLNNWVTANSGHGYATWMRTMGSPINDDYPIFRRTDAVCVS